MGATGGVIGLLGILISICGCFIEIADQGNYTWPWLYYIGAIVAGSGLSLILLYLLIHLVLRKLVIAYG